MNTSESIKLLALPRRSQMASAKKAASMKPTAFVTKINDTTA